MPISATDLNKAYLAYFGRPVDFTGKTHFANLELADVIKAFDSSAESQALYGSDVAAKVNAIYNNLFNRDAEPAGLLHWSTLIGQGRITAAEAAFKIMEGALGSDVTAVQNKLSASEAFAAELNTTAELLGYSGMAAAAAARAFLKTVDATPASLTAAVAKVAETVATVAASGGPAGQTFTLTAGADNITGTSGNDTITALTVNAAGTPATTLSAFDSIDGGAGTDTLNIYSTSTGPQNASLPASASIKNVESISIYNDGAAFHTGTVGTIDASKFAGVTNLLQATLAADVTNLAAATTATFKGQNTSAAADLSVTAASGVASAKVALDGVKGTDVAPVGTFAAGENTAHLTVAGDALASVTVSGTLAQAVVSTAAAAAANLTLNVTAGKDVETLTVNTAVKSTLAITEGAGTAAAKEVKVVDASSSTGGVTYDGTVTSGANVRTIKTGAGADTVTIATATTKDDATTAADETVSALLETGAGNDTITINTSDAAASAAGKTTVNAGEGNDTVTLTADGTGVLTVNLGAGDDTFKGAGSVAATDVIDGGDGTDTLLLNMVGAANIGAFSNFETFDAAGLAKTLDVEILAAKNTVTEFVATADVGAAAVLTNLGAGVSFRATGDMTTNALTLTQKTAGALTVTLDADSTSTTAQNDTNLKAVASNATSLKAVFAADSGYNDPATNTNDQTITLTGTKATALEVVSGGTNATNTLAYTSGVSATAGKDLLASITISGDKALSVTVTESAASTSQVTSINASALTGKLTISTVELKAESAANTFDGGVLTLGSGADVINITQGAVISGLSKGTVEDATLQGTFDVLSTGAAVAQAADVAATATLTIKDGKFTFNGTGPATLADAISAVDTQLTTAGEAVVFEYVGNSYVYVDGGAGADLVVKLTGITGLTGLDEVGTTNNLYVF